MEQRSTYVTVVGWIFIVFSGLGLLEGLFFAFIPFDKFFASLPPPPNGQPAPDPALFMGILRGMMLVMCLIASWVLLSSIGLVMRKNWARISFLVIMGIGCAFSLIYLLFGLLGLFFMPTSLPSNGQPEMAVFARSMMLFMVILSALFGAFYGWTLYKLCTAKIVREFRAEPAPPAPVGN